MSNKRRFVGERLELGNLIRPAKVERCGGRKYPILSITKDEGIVLQSEKFKKRIASKDTSSYKVVPRDKLVQGIHIDEANFAIQNLVDYGIVSPAYKIWDIEASLVEPEYLALALRSEPSLAYYRRNLVGTVNRRGRMSNEVFYRLKVRLPSLDGQREVLSVLGDVTKQISLARQQVDLLDSLVKSRFAEMFEGSRWPEVPASNVMHDFRNGVSPSKKGEFSATVLTLSAITQGTFRPEEQKSGSFKTYPMHEKRVSKGIFMMCRGNGNISLVGRGAFSDCDYSDLVFPDTVIAAQVQDDLIDCSYLSNLWNCSCVREQIEAKARTTNGTYKINQQMIKTISIPLPPLALQREFAAFAAQVDKSRFVAQQQIEKLQMLYDSLAQDYFGD